MGSASFVELGFTVSSLGMLLAYHGYLVVKVRTDPLQTSIGMANCLRGEWVKSVMEEKRDILAVQTLRNWVMAASFLASTAILLAIGILSVAFKSERLSALTQAVNLVGSQNETLWFVKLLLLTVDFFFAFFNFSLAIRHYNHVGYMINVPHERDTLATPDYIAQVLHHGTIHYTIGMRGYYLAIPLALWLFGPTWFLIGTLILVIVLFKPDRMP
jgi:uncharacterized membrane protein